MPRTGLPEPQDFDVDHCVELHNKIVHACVAQNPDITLTRGYFKFHTQQSPEIAPLLQLMRHDFDDDKLCAFLDAVDIPDPDEKLRISFTPEVLELCQPSEMWDGWNRSLIRDTWLVVLYRAHNWENGRGLVYDLATRSATFVEGVNDAVLPPFWKAEKGARLWLSLEEVLQEWWDRIKNGKYIPIPRDNPSQILIEGEAVGWEVVPFRPQDLKATLHAWSDLIDAIVARMPRQSIPISPEARSPTPQGMTLATTSLLDTYHVGGFLRSFLAAARKPPASLLFVAPGLLCPTAAFLARSLHLTHTRQLAEDSRNQSSTDDSQAPPPPAVPSILFPLHSAYAAPSLTHGLALCPDGNKTWEDAAALTLPADTSDISKSVRLPWATREMNVMFQQGRCPFGYDHCARLEEILVKWKELIELGVWKVGKQGVEGGKEWLEEKCDAELIEREGFGIESVCGM